ncbi:unnamed protein product, partial [Prorocentrum cordatum]
AAQGDSLCPAARPLPIHCSRTRGMLDLVTLFASVGLQEELAESQKRAPVITEAGADTSFAEDAAQQISAALESVEGALSSAVGAVFGAGEPAQAPCKKA